VPFEFMRIRTQAGLGPQLLALAVALASSACGAASTGNGANVRSPELQTGERELSERLSEQAQRIAELEARIALLESEARSGRAVGPSHGSDTIRIAGVQSEPAGPALTASVPDASDDGPVPSYKLYGKGGRANSGSAAGRELEPLPVVSESLPVVPLPEQRARDLTRAPERRAGPVAQYRGALQLLKDRHFDEALAAFDAMLAQNPTHPLAPKALYWRGEARYAKREYDQALREFEVLLERFPESEKAPDALLKTALCFRRLGAEDKAQASFRRLRADYPNSQAALIASREGST
jgi:tol-pal system protein YbgF